MQYISLCLHVTVYVSEIVEIVGETVCFLGIQRVVLFHL